MNANILVVDDNADIRAILRDILESAGFHWIPASDGEYGLEIAFQRCPDLILLDVNMPRMNGIEMLRALRKTVCHAPVILVTADADFQVALDAFRLGVRDYIIKPFTPEEVLQTVTRVLENTHLEKAKIQLMRQLVEAEAVRQTTATLAHHINNSLMSLGGSLYLLLESAEHDNYPKDILKLIRSGLEDAREIARVLRYLQNTTNVQKTPYFDDIMMLETNAESESS